MSLQHIQPWWQRIGCAHNPGASSGEESARDAEIAELRTALQLAERAALAGVNYDKAIQSCANDPARMSSFCTAEGDDLGTLYAEWVDKCREVLGS